MVIPLTLESSLFLFFHYYGSAHLHYRRRLASIIHYLVLARYPAIQGDDNGDMLTCGCLFLFLILLHSIVGGFFGLCGEGEGPFLDRETVLGWTWSFGCFTLLASFSPNHHHCTQSGWKLAENMAAITKICGFALAGINTTIPENGIPSFASYCHKHANRFIWSETEKAT